MGRGSHGQLWRVLLAEGAASAEALGQKGAGVVWGAVRRPAWLETYVQEREKQGDEVGKGSVVDHAGSCAPGQNFGVGSAGGF